MIWNMLFTDNNGDTIDVAVDMDGASILDAFNEAGVDGVAGYLADKGFWEAVTSCVIQAIPSEDFPIPIVNNIQNYL